MSTLCWNFVRFTQNESFRRYFASPSFRSAISLQNLHPSSSLKLTTPNKLEGDSSDKFNGYIPIKELEITYSRSTGPGGQNVNKVNTKVEVRFNLKAANWINESIKSKLLEKFKNRLTKEGDLIFRSDLTRSQQLNLADCLEKIRSSVRSCELIEEKPSEETLEKIRRRMEKSTRERLALKRMRSQVKSDRQSPLVIE